jgi:hypothetical protein
VAGTSIYCFGIGLIFSTLYRFTLFSNNLPKGTVSASLNIVVLTTVALSIEGALAVVLWRRAYSVSSVALVTGCLAILCLNRLVRRVQQYPPLNAANLAADQKNHIFIRL